jgi:sugar (pentulose or hexulose) kinase
VATSLVLAIDVGSTAVRAAVVGPGGEVRASTRQARPDSLSGVTFDAALLWNQVVDAVAGLPAGLRGAVAGLAIAGHIGTVFTDSGFDPVGPGLGWADSSGVDLLAERLGPDLDPTLTTIGRATVTGGPAAATLGFRASDPQGFARVRRILTPKDYLVGRLTGESTTDHTGAAYSGLSDVRAREWSGRILDLLGIDEALLPRQVASTAIVGAVSSGVSGRLGLPAGLPVIAGGPDGSMGAAYVLAGSGDAIADVAGTTDVLVRPVPGPESSPPKAMLNPYIFGGWSAGGATGMTGGALNRWAMLLGEADAASALARFGDEVEGLSPGADGLVARPTLSGSRFPRWVPGEVGLISGQVDSHGPAHFVRAVIEGASYVVREGVDLLAPGHEAEVVLAGGAARSPLLAQLRADVLGRQVRVCAEPDVSLMGAAMIAMLGCGIHSSPAAAAEAMEQDWTLREPDPASAARYEELFGRWREITTGDIR